MSRIVLSPRAKEDLIEIWTYIATDNPVAADRMLDVIDEKLAMLAANPRLGPARPDIAEGVRLLPIKRYVILYREVPGGIEAVRVVQGMRRLVALV
jgi:toxin ParE1/3/4